MNTTQPVVGKLADPNVVVVSADSHVGAELLDYKSYLATRWHDDFDSWAAHYENPWDLLDEDTDITRKGAREEDVNWDSDTRLAECDRDGVAAEVLYPNTVPPFFPSWSLFGTIPSPDEYARRWAGLQAHNRWRAEFCAAAPERRAGLVQLFLNNVDDALNEVRWAREHGLRGVLIGAVPPGHAHVRQLWDSYYEPLWALCADLEMPITQHFASGSPDDVDPRNGVARACVLTEYDFYNRRTLTALIFGGVFERHPRLRFVFAEAGAKWVPPLIGELDALWQLGKNVASTSAAYMRDVSGKLPRRPSEYFRRNCWVGTFLRPGDVDLGDVVPVERIMWASDFPHDEGSYPCSREAMRVAVGGAADDEIRLVLGGNAIEVYGLDARALQSVADRIGPAIADVCEPLQLRPKASRPASAAFVHLPA